MSPKPGHRDVERNWATHGAALNPIKRFAHHLNMVGEAEISMSWICIMYCVCMWEIIYGIHLLDENILEIYYYLLPSSGCAK